VAHFPEDGNCWEFIIILPHSNANGIFLMAKFELGRTKELEMYSGKICLQIWTSLNFWISSSKQQYIYEVCIYIYVSIKDICSLFLNIWCCKGALQNQLEGASA
jgi:hypothetical protein